MPRSNTSHLAETFMCLPRELFRTPAVRDSLKAVTFRNSNDIDTLILLKDASGFNTLLEEPLRIFNFVRNGTTVNLNLHEVCLLLLEASFADLSVRKDTDDSAVFPDTLELTGDGFAAFFSMFLSVSGEGFLL